MQFALILLLGVFANIAAGVVTYNNHALYRIVPKDSESVDILRLLEKSESEKYDFWTSPGGADMPVDILVSPQQKDAIEKLINEYKMDYKILKENIQENIDEEARVTKSKLYDCDDFTWDRYNDLDTINNWLRKLAKQYPDIVTLLNGGKSYENRTILGVKVSYGPQNKNRGVWIDSNIHAREWISSATSTFILNAILTSDDPIVRRTAESHDWYFFPVINPDGLVYTHTTDRLWRKNRSPPYGVDLNRNWDYKWNGDGCTSSNESDVYCGTAPFSEIEASSLANFISTVAEDLVLLLTLHSYGQLLIIPYGDSTKHVDNYDVTYAAAVKAAESLARRYGTIYTIGTVPEVIFYEAYGSSMDWAKAQYHIPYAYSYELRDVDDYGFLLPEYEIIPTGLETLDSIITLLEEADKQLLSSK